MSATLEVARSMAHKHLIDDALWERLTARIREDLEFQSHFGELGEPEQVAWSERILNETLGFLVLNAPQVHFYAMAPLVDIGWHTFLVYTREYAMFCDRIGGRFIHHSPCDVPGLDYGPAGQAIVLTIAAMREHGMVVDEELWVGNLCCGEGCSSGTSGCG